MDRLCWLQRPDHPYRTLIVAGFESGKTNALLNLRNHQPYIDKIYLYTKNSNESKYQLLIKEREDLSQKYSSDPRDFIKC